MADFVPIGMRNLNLDLIAEINLNQPWPEGKAGTCVEVVYPTGRVVRHAMDSEMGEGLARWAEGLEGREEESEEPARPRPIVLRADPDRLPRIDRPASNVLIGRVGCTPLRNPEAVRAMVQASVDFAPAVSVPCCHLRDEGGAA